MKKTLAFLLSLILGLCLTGCGDETSTSVDDSPAIDEPAVEQQTETDNTTLGEKNALKTAETYLSSMAFSKSGLVEQLEYEGYTNSEATFAVENCGADWNEQAAEKAQEYLDSMSFSRDGLIDQLKYEGFTQSQAEYGVSAVEY